MAGKQLREIQQPFSDPDGHKSQVVSSAFIDSCYLKSLDRVLNRQRTKSKAYKDVETDQENGGSSEEIESPKSVAQIDDWRKKLSNVHYQILRIREEDMHFGEDIGEGFNAKEKITVGGQGDFSHLYCNHTYPYHRVRSEMEVVSFSRPILPSSPLSGKTRIRALN